MCNNDLSFNYCIFVTVNFLKVSTEKKMIKMSSWGYLLFPTWQLNISSAQISIQSLRRRKKNWVPQEQALISEESFQLFFPSACRNGDTTNDTKAWWRRSPLYTTTAGSVTTYARTNRAHFNHKTVLTTHTHSQIDTTSTEVLNPITYTHKARA